MLELYVACLVLGVISIGALLYALKLQFLMNSDKYRQTVCNEVLKERRGLGLGSSDVRKVCP